MGIACVVKSAGERGLTLHDPTDVNYQTHRARTWNSGCGGLGGDGELLFNGYIVFLGDDGRFQV